MMFQLEEERKVTANLSRTLELEKRKVKSHHIINFSIFVLTTHHKYFNISIFTITSKCKTVSSSVTHVRGAQSHVTKEVTPFL